MNIINDYLNRACVPLGRFLARHGTSTGAAIGAISAITGSIACEQFNTYASVPGMVMDDTYVNRYSSEICGSLTGLGSYCAMTHIANQLIQRYEDHQLQHQGESWTVRVAHHVNEIHDDAQLRQEAYERTNSITQEFFPLAILEYLQTSSREKGQLIEDFESCDPQIYLEILEQVVLKAITSEEPLIHQDGSSQRLPFCLLNIGRELEMLRTEKCLSSAKKIASELQQMVSVKVAMQTAITSVLESSKYNDFLQKKEKKEVCLILLTNFCKI